MRKNLGVQDISKQIRYSRYFQSFQNTESIFIFYILKKKYILNMYKNCADNREKSL